MLLFSETRPIYWTALPPPSLPSYNVLQTLPCATPPPATAVTSLVRYLPPTTFLPKQFQLFFDVESSTEEYAQFRRLWDDSGGLTHADNVNGNGNEHGPRFCKGGRSDRIVIDHSSRSNSTVQRLGLRFTPRVVGGDARVAQRG